MKDTTPSLVIMHKNSIYYMTQTRFSFDVERNVKSRS